MRTIFSNTFDIEVSISNKINKDIKSIVLKDISFYYSNINTKSLYFDVHDMIVPKYSKYNTTEFDIVISFKAMFKISFNETLLQLGEIPLEYAKLNHFIVTSIVSNNNEYINDDAYNSIVQKVIDNKIESNDIFCTLSISSCLD